MGRKHIVPYGLYMAKGFIAAPLAVKTGFNDEDLQLLWNALGNMFEHDRSAARGFMSSRKLIVFKHDSELGNAPAHKLFDAIKIERKNNTRPARKFDDYSVVINKDEIPKGVTLQELM